MTVRPAVLTAALTGPIATKQDNPHLPTTPEEIAAAAAAAYQAGAAVVHIHLRDAQGLPTADLAVARRTVELIEAACPVLVQLSTGVGLDVAYEDRMRLVELAPRMATLNVCTMSFGRGEFRNPPAGVRRLAARMRELAIKPELEIYDSGHLDVVHTLIAEDLIELPITCSLVLGVQGGMSATPDNLIHLVGKLPAGAIWQVIGVGRANLPLTAIGLAMGGNARSGMEDTLWLRRGRPAQSNAELVERMASLAITLDREIATVEQAAAQLALPPRVRAQTGGP
jgi:3-keto-5-aminohexanoate cleavage enzyme